MNKAWALLRLASPQLPNPLPATAQSAPQEQPHE